MGGIAYGLDAWAGLDFPTVLALSVFGSFISYIYSAPPLKLKQNGWAGNYALGCSYISLPWWCGQDVFGELDRPVYFILPILYSIGETTYAAGLLGLLLPQIYFQATLLLPDPVANDVKYQAQSQPFFVFGILATALCLGHHDFGA